MKKQQKKKNWECGKIIAENSEISQSYKKSLKYY